MGINNTSILTLSPLYPSAEEHLNGWAYGEPQPRYQWQKVAILTAWVALPLLLAVSTSLCLSVAYILSITTAVYVGWRYHSYRQKQQVEPIVMAGMANHINSKFKEWVRLVITRDNEQLRVWKDKNRVLIDQVRRLRERLALSQYLVKDSIRFLELKKACDHFFTPTAEIYAYHKSLLFEYPPLVYTDVRSLISEAVQSSSKGKE